MAGGVRDFDPTRLRAAQAKAGLSVRQLARAIGVRPAIVFGWRTGRSTPFPRNLKRVAEALGCKTTYLAPLPERPGLGHYRERAGMNQAELGSLVGTNAHTVSQVESAAQWPADPEPWAEAYGLSLASFTRAWRNAARRRRLRQGD